jgi:LmbE family N-acetylglucosaminyl deacetylase
MDPVKTLILSPHLDDAVFSLGGFMGSHPGCTVMTVFAGIPSKSQELTDYDRKCGFNSSEQAVKVRRSEDVRALSVLKATPIHLNYLDSQYENGDDDFEIKNLSHFDLVLAPLGMHHPDHIETSKLGQWLARDHAMNVCYYTELPYRRIFPGLAQDRAAELGLVELPEPTQNSVFKRLACSQYHSQWGKDDITPDNIFIGEQIWTKL